MNEGKLGPNEEVPAAMPAFVEIAELLLGNQAGQRWSAQREVSGAASIDVLIHARYPAVVLLLQLHRKGLPYRAAIFFGHMDSVEASRTEILKDFHAFADLREESRGRVTNPSATGVFTRPENSAGVAALRRALGDIYRGQGTTEVYEPPRASAAMRMDKSTREKPVKRAGTTIVEISDAVPVDEEFLKFSQAYAPLYEKPEDPL